MFANLLSSLLLVLVANLVFSALVPRIENQNLQLLPLAENKYSLKVRHSDGSTLEEIVEKTGPGQYKVKGIIDVPFTRPIIPETHEPWIYIGRDANGNPIKIKQYPYNNPLYPQLAQNIPRTQPELITNEEP